jgi:dTDP-4-amino-4,6-dideoxy-D-glucose ammonia-lyase
MTTDVWTGDLRDRLMAALAREPSAGEAPEPRREAAGQLAQLAGLYVENPFLALEAARERLGVDRVRMAALLRSAGLPDVRAAVLAGPTHKYWTKTILPLEASGSLDAVLGGIVRYPQIVGLFPGPTCMFRCAFCGRVTGNRYPAAAVEPGNAVFEAVIDELPTDDPARLYFSGGLEPLTNPGLGDLARRGAARGFAMTLYTNGFALTPATLRRQPGLWDLAVIRVSLYGTDEEEYASTTGRRGAFARVRDNLIAFQREAARRGRGPALGLNYVILPGQVGRLARLADLVADLDAAYPGRPVSFLTLREEYSGRPEAGALTDADHERLVEGLAAFERRAARLAPALSVDYGYALHAVREGMAHQLPRIGWAQLRPGAHPQVAVQLDPLGNVFLYREAAFPGLPGADRYVIGRIGPGTGLGEVVEAFVTSGAGVPAEAGDELYLDGFDHVVTARLRQLEADLAAGWGAARGLLR